MSLRQKLFGQRSAPVPRAPKGSVLESLQQIHQSTKAISAKDALKVLEIQHQIVRTSAHRPTSYEALLVRPQLHHKDPAVREQAAAFAAECVAVLIRGLADPDERVRNAASGDLSYFGEVALNALAESLKDPDHDVRWRAANALGHMDTRLDHLQKQGEMRMLIGGADEYAGEVATALAEMSRALDLLIGATTDTDQYVREVATAGVNRLRAVLGFEEPASARADSAGLFFFDSEDMDSSTDSRVFSALTEAFKSDKAGAEAVRASSGDLFDHSFTGGTPGQKVLINWLRSSSYGPDTGKLKADIAGRLKSGSALDFIPYVIAVGPAENRRLAEVDRMLTEASIVAYLGLVMLSAAPPMGNLSMDLHLIPFNLRYTDKGFERIFI
ncbi:MAG TPA: HEAT repeat domain-containing protein [Acidimicrobiales bacterium]|nr:HEAT repeat domain-containing protein [Acidimicrobiales bacterium]